MIENNVIVSEEIQQKRYLQGKKANWRNPNSTGTKNLTENDNVNSYISKYINKSNTEEEEQQQLKIKQFWGCNDELKQLKYATFKETELTIETELQLIDNQTKTIYNDKNQIKIKAVIRLLFEGIKYPLLRILFINNSLVHNYNE